MAFTVTDRDLLSEVEYHLLENGDADADYGTTLLTGMFTQAMWITALNNRQRQFVKDTGMVLTRTTVAGIAGQPRYAYPTDWVTTRRIAWQDIDGTIIGLTRADAYELDRGMYDWTSDTARPLAWQDSTVETLKFELAKAPNDLGTVHILYAALSTALSNSGVVLSVPDEFAWVVKWGALAELLGQDGEAHDPTRAGYCELRYAQGVELARLLMEGVTSARR